MDNHLMAAYSPLPVQFVRGEGVWLYDEQEQAYLDALSGIAVCGLGHCHPLISEAIRTQASRLLHTSNLYRIPLQEQLASRLCELSGMENAFFCNSGAEANEAAIKLARLHASRQGWEAPRIVVMEGAFHGRTMATLSATASPAAQKGFEPLLPGFLRVPFNDLDTLGHAFEQQRITAVLLEPIQGEGGIRIPDHGYLPGVRALCDRFSALMMLDEVQSGMCRTGKWFAWQHEDACPDVMTLAKSLGNGVPIGACLARGAAADLFLPGSHGSTFGGNPLAAAAGLAVLEALETGRLAQRAEQAGQRILKTLSRQLGNVPEVRELRGQGLMIGIELDRDCSGLPAQALPHGLLINVTAGHVIRLLPPLIIDDEEIEELCTRLSRLIQDFLAEDKT